MSVNMFSDFVSLIRYYSKLSPPGMIWSRLCIKALERAQGWLRLPNGQANRGFNHEYKRNGTTTLFTPLPPSSPEALREAFLREKTPKVDKGGCFSLNCICYEAGIEYIGKQILVRYDPSILQRLKSCRG